MQTLFFIEVPDGMSPMNGAQLGKVDVPHTYYFKKAFFKSIFNNIDFLASLPSGSELLDRPACGDISYESTDKGIIRCVGSGINPEFKTYGQIS